MSDQPPKPRTIGTDGGVFRCPICKQPVGSTSAAFPFCSDRCRLRDLDNWLSGSYTLTRPIDPTDNLDEIPIIRATPPKPQDD
jgi:endogenous inhibitor of DNA gyrase (YacG/DUF329 family)